VPFSIMPSYSTSAVPPPNRSSSPQKFTVRFYLHRIV
jgi:hypothetical protein